MLFVLECFVLIFQLFDVLLRPFTLTLLPLYVRVDIVDLDFDGLHICLKLLVDPVLRVNGEDITI